MRLELWKRTAAGNACVAAGEQAAVWALLPLYGPLAHVPTEETGAWKFAGEYHAGWYKPDRRGNRLLRTGVDFYLTIRPEPVATRTPQDAGEYDATRCWSCDGIQTHGPICTRYQEEENA